MIVYQNFEWDFREAASNLATYGVTFKEASTIFAADDVAFADDLDSDHVFATGTSARGRVLVVGHRRGARIRILGAMVQAKTEARVAVENLDKETAASGEAAATEIVATADRTEAQEVPGPQPPVSARAARFSLEEAASDPKPRAPSSSDARSFGSAPKAAVRTSGPRRVPRDHGTALVPGGRAAAIVQESAPVVAPARRGASPKPVAEPPAPVATAVASSSRIPGAGMSAEEYETYWAAYSAARDEAKRQGKNVREAQRIGREAGEHAVAGRASVPAAAGSSPQAPGKRADSWRAAARATKLDG